MLARWAGALLGQRFRLLSRAASPFIAHRTIHQRSRIALRLTATQQAGISSATMTESGTNGTTAAAQEVEELRQQLAKLQVWSH